MFRSKTFFGLFIGLHHPLGVTRFALELPPPDSADTVERYKPHRYSAVVTVGMGRLPVRRPHFKIGDGGPVNITTAFGNIVVTRMGSSGASKGGAIVLAPDIEPYISNSGDLTRDKMAKLVEMVMENADR